MKKRIDFYTGFVHKMNTTTGESAVSDSDNFIDPTEGQLVCNSDNTTKKNMKQNTNTFILDVSHLTCKLQLFFYQI